MQYTDKWISIRVYYDEDGTELEYMTNKELDKYYIKNKIKETQYENRKIIYRVILGKKPEQLTLF